MLGREALINHCLSLPNVYEDYPFDENWAAMRITPSKKTFAFIYEREGQLWVNVKCDPMEADFLRSVFPAVIPAYHMNKRHWNTLVIDGSMADNLVLEMIDASYNIVHK